MMENTAAAGAEWAEAPSQLGTKVIYKLHQEWRDF